MLPTHVIRKHAEKVKYLQEVSQIYPKTQKQLLMNVSFMSQFGSCFQFG